MAKPVFSYRREMTERYPRTYGSTIPATWADDGETDGHAIRSGTLTCSAF